MSAKDIPLPLEPIKSHSSEDKRLWIGNLDLRINEYQLLKITQQYGKIDKFDLLFHRSGPLAGQPRGYAFVTYTSLENAEKARIALNDMKLGSKNIIVRWAHSMSETDMEKSKTNIEIPALAGAKKNDKVISRQTAIQAIEAKLKLMKECKEEFQLNKPLEGVSIIQQYQKPECEKPSSSIKHHHHHHRHHNRPYSKSKPRR